MKFVRCYLTTANGSAVQAARQAGYKAPSESGSRLFRRLSSVIEEERRKASEVKHMGPQDILKGLAEIAWDKEHRDRYNALKTLAALYKIDEPEVDRKRLAADLDTVIQVLRVNKLQLQAISKPDSQPRLTRAKTD